MLRIKSFHLKLNTTFPKGTILTPDKIGTEIIVIKEWKGDNWWKRFLRNFNINIPINTIKCKFLKK